MFRSLLICLRNALGAWIAVMGIAAILWLILA